MKKKDNKLNMGMKWKGGINHPILWKLMTNYLNREYSTTMNVDRSNGKLPEDSIKIIGIPDAYSYHNVNWGENGTGARCLNFTIDKEDLEIYLDTINYLSHRYDKLLDVKVIYEGI